MGTPESDPESERASAPVIGDVLMVAVAVLAAIVLIVFALDAFAGLPIGTPYVSASADTVVVGPADSCGVNEVTLRHESGGTVAVADLAIVVRLTDANDAMVRVENFPVTDGTLEARNVERNASIVSHECVGGALTESGGTWTAGAPLTIQLNRSYVDAGDSIEVRVVHQPSGRTVVTKRLVAEAS